MRVALKVVVSVDVDAYRAEYAEDLSLDDIRNDIESDLAHAADNAFPARLGQDVFPKVEVRKA